MTVYRGRFFMRDDNGFYLAPGFYTSNLAHATSMVNGLALISNGGLVNARYTHYDTAIEPTTPGGTASVEEAARLTYATATGKQVVINIPAPGSIFMSDAETVDPSILVSSGWQALALAALTDRGGNAVTTYVSGRVVLLPVPPLPRL